MSTRINAKVVLDEKQFGHLVDECSKPTTIFYYITYVKDKETKKEKEIINFVTARCIDTLVAVTKEQYNNWKAQKLFYISKENWLNAII